MSQQAEAVGDVRLFLVATIKKRDEAAYETLQSQLRDESVARKLHPVQYDDILWRRLNRHRRIE